MKTSLAYISISLVLLLIVPVSFAEEQARSEPEKKPIAAWIGQENKRRLVRLLKDFHRICRDDERDAVGGAIRTFETAQGTVKLNEDTTCRLTGCHSSEVPNRAYAGPGGTRGVRFGSVTLWQQVG